MKQEKKYVLCIKQGHEPVVITLDQPNCNAEILASKLFKDADGKPFNLDRVDIASVKSVTAKLTISYETEKFGNVELVEEEILINIPQSKVDVETKPTWKDKFKSIFKLKNTDETNVEAINDAGSKTTIVSSSKIQIFEDEIVGESVSSIKRKAEDILDENASKLEMLSFDEHTEIVLKGASTYKMKWTATKFSKGNGYFRGWSFGENGKKTQVEPRWKASIWPILAIIALGIISFFTFSGRGSDKVRIIV